MKIQKLSEKHFYMIAVALCFIECLSFKVYAIANNSMYFLTALMVVIDFLIIRKINIKGIGLLLFTVAYFIIDNIYLTGTFILGTKYAVIFLAIYLFERISFDKSFWQFGFFFGLVYTLRYVFVSERYLEEFNYQSRLLGGIKDVQVLNINIPCFMIFICFILVALYCKTNKSKHEKIITTISLVVNVYISYKFDCRITILTSLLLFFLFEFVPIRIWNNKKVVLGGVTFLFLVGCLYPLIVITFFYNGSTIASELIFSGRERIWVNYFSIIKNDPMKMLFGLGYNYRIAVSNGLSLHNSFLEWAFNFGFVGVFLYWLVTFKTIKNAFDNGINEYKLYLLVSYVVMLIFAFANTAIQREYLFIFYSMFLGLSNNSSLIRKGDSLDETDK